MLKEQKNDVFILCVIAILSVLLATPMAKADLVAETNLDIDWICITSSRTYFDGSAVHWPWQFEIWVYLADPGDLDYIAITRPGSDEPFVTLGYNGESGRWGDFNSWTQYDSLESLRQFYPEGEYKFEFYHKSDTNSPDKLLKTVSLDYSHFPDGPTGPVNIIYPPPYEAGTIKEDISTIPTFIWEVPSGDGGVLMMSLQEDQGDIDVYESLAPTTTTSWTPGPLLHETGYDFEISACNVKDWIGPGWPTMTVGNDTFSYTLMIEYLNETKFTTVSEPVIEATLRIDPDTITPKSKWIICHLWFQGLNYADIDPDSIRLNGSIKPAGPSMGSKGHQQAEFSGPLTWRFYASELNLAPRPEPYSLIVSGKLFNGTTFAGSDDLTVTGKGREKK